MKVYIFALFHIPSDRRMQKYEASPFFLFITSNQDIFENCGPLDLN